MNAPRALLVAALCLGTSALAWESVCTQSADPTVEVDAYPRTSAPACSPDAGPNTARQRWLGVLDEHRRLFELSRQKAGLPASVSATVRLRVFTSSAPVQVGTQTLTSLRPAPFAEATRVQTRAFSIGELAQLPDFSYALWDWAEGHETCPLPGVDADPVACHDFSSHMGPVNANHFLPLAGDFYARYHRLALAQAAECAQLRDRLGARAAEFTAFTDECETLALTLEAVAHHYLQDAFSMGHMWQRWGSAELADFPGATPLEQRDRAVLVALVSGMIHGSRGVLQALPGWTSFDVNDALSAPNANVALVSGDGTSMPGVGDDYLEPLLSPEYASQAALLFACAESGLKQVYLASGSQHGPLADGTAVLGLVDPEGPLCFGQRATNRAMVEAAAIQFKFVGVQHSLPLDARMVGYLVPKVARSQGEVPVDAGIKNPFRYGMQRWTSLARLAGKDAPGRDHRGRWRARRPARGEAERGVPREGPAHLVRRARAPLAGGVDRLGRDPAAGVRARAAVPSGDREGLVRGARCARARRAPGPRDGRDARCRRACRGVRGVHRARRPARAEQRGRSGSAVLAPRAWLGGRERRWVGRAGAACARVLRLPMSGEGRGWARGGSSRTCGSRFAARLRLVTEVPSRGTLGHFLHLQPDRRTRRRQTRWSLLRPFPSERDGSWGDACSERASAARLHRTGPHRPTRLPVTRWMMPGRLGSRDRQRGAEAIAARPGTTGDGSTPLRGQPAGALRRPA